ncbi:MAG: AAA family ATPase [candidate division KSB1 bacterium]|nr:AAA family ATPase [candidate division KSB1 bacterium]MDZ7342497.1 AAA family ATPase [candidate division KSB1 bacterium]
MSMVKEFPRWLQEFKRFQALKSQFYLYGNVYDCYYFHLNHHQVAGESKIEDWKKFNTLPELLKRYLRNEQYELICYYDMIDGFELTSTDANITRDNLLQFLTAGNAELAKNFDANLLKNGKRKLDDVLNFFRLLVSNTKKLSAGIINYASRFTSNPNSLEEEERREFLKILKAAQEAFVFREKNDLRNVLIFICDKLSDIPAWVLLENPLTKGIQIDKPDKRERQRFLKIQGNLFYREGEPVNQAEIEKVFPDLTDGLYNRELENLITISKQEKIHVNNIRQIIELFKYGTKENFWEDLDHSKIEEAEAKLRERVKGQAAAIKKSVEIIRRAKLGLHSIDQARPKNKPKGVLFFAGPTGVGKTELAKSLAELIFSDEDAVIRFDMSEYNDSNSDVKLIGSPPGYVGYEEGGQLTSRVRSKPFSIILFDEIEKAHPIVFDKFLQILDDGRLTDGKGETVYFSETLIIFTSNLGVYKEDEHGRRTLNIDIEKDSYEQMSQKIKEEIKLFFGKKLNRPEILNRFGENFVVFDFIRPPVDKEILEKNLKIIQANLLKQKNCRFEFDNAFVEQFLEYHVKDNLINGGRGIINRIEEHIKNGIANFMFQQQKDRDLHFRAIIDPAQNNAVVFQCIGN